MIRSRMLPPGSINVSRFKLNVVKRSVAVPEVAPNVPLNGTQMAPNVAKLSLLCASWRLFRARWCLIYAFEVQAIEHKRAEILFQPFGVQLPRAFRSTCCLESLLTVSDSVLLLHD